MIHSEYAGLSHSSGRSVWLKWMKKESKERWEEMGWCLEHGGLIGNCKDMGFYPECHRDLEQ